MNKLITALVLGMVATAMAMEPGEYKGQGNSEKLFVTSRGENVITFSRQVGASRPIAGELNVPYPTVCNYVEIGKVIREDANYLEYELRSLLLMGPKEAKDLENCSIWFAFLNSQVASGNIISLLAKTDYTKMN